MFSFTGPMDGKDYLVVTIDVRGGAQIAMTDLAAAPAEQTRAPIDFALSGVARRETHLPIRAEHIAILDPRWAVVAWRRPRTAYRLDLGTRMAP